MVPRRKRWSVQSIVSYLCFYRFEHNRGWSRIPSKGGPQPQINEILVLGGAPLDPPLHKAFNRPTCHINLATNIGYVSESTTIRIKLDRMQLLGVSGKLIFYNPFFPKIIYPPPGLTFLHFHVALKIKVL